MNTFVGYLKQAMRNQNMNCLVLFLIPIVGIPTVVAFLDDGKEYVVMSVPCPWNVKYRVDFFTVLFSRHSTG